ncbi:activator of hsp90 atpase 1 family protein [Colletotrichum karsti]|uniref:Activator of hsp90 atpase 1 family protein n=1 Tax=Colletotrichum karsti TaxID=1095194 RepID=A0A9P6I525_9PEZI|nr:activator of hsp90 atpase 1 family protein [Colletotrichum karsti]KAF9876379.1 activator of hsp90 atpase 1 family protein [Colletotrichum karsti]
MGSGQSIATEIEIAAPPATVRSVFLDWQRYSEWTKVWTIKPNEDAKKPSDLTKGDYVAANLKGFAFKPAMVENTEELFKWDGSIPLLFSGQHSFYFKPSDKTPGGTTWVQVEDFSGLLAFLMKPVFGFTKTTLKNWREFDEDIKKESERIAVQN